MKTVILLTDKYLMHSSSENLHIQPTKARSRLFFHPSEKKINFSVPYIKNNCIKTGDIFASEKRYFNRSSF